MRASVFLDTSAWFAAISEREAQHVSAATCYTRLIAEHLPLLTTNLVLAEMYALLRRRSAARTAIAFLEQVHKDPLHEVVWATKDLERRAVDRWLRPFAGQRFSLTDAVGFEVMRERGVTKSFTTDRDFTVAGFDVVP